MIKQKRFLGNTKTVEIHDALNENPSCQLDEIEIEHRRWYAALVEAYQDFDFSPCVWCLGSSTR